MEPFDKNKKFLGILCRRGHNFDSTGKSLRYKSQKRCVECSVEDGGKYLLKNQEKIKEYRIANREKKISQAKRWRLKNKENVKKYRKKYNHDHTEERKEYTKKYNIENKEKNRRRRERYKKENPEKLKSVQKKSRDKNREAILERKHIKNVFNSITLSDSYIKDIIPIPTKQITEDMIKLKRNQLKLHRGIKTLKREIKNVTN